MNMPQIDDTEFGIVAVSGVMVMAHVIFAMLVALH